jgi:UDP-N-acetylmuramyl pentapeptide synthase
LADFRAVAGRLQLKAGVRDSWIIDDSYNANPSSVRAGLEVLRSAAGRTWLVLADMAELGERYAADSHAHMGATRVIAASSACSRWGRRARARSRPSVPAPNGSPTPMP